MKTSAAKNGAVIYCRVSTKEQQENLSLPVQESTCRKWCASEGHTVLEVFREAESAKTTHRAVFQRMLEYCSKNHSLIGTVVFYDASRFSRENSDYLNVRAYLRSKGIVTRSATQFFDESPAGELMESMLASWATFDNRMRAQKTIEGMKAKIELGHWVHKPPLGYKSVPKAAKDEANLIPDEKRAPLIKKAFELYSTGSDSKAGVLANLTSLGLIDVSGSPLSPQTFDKLLRNPIYSGWIVSAWGITVRGKFEPIVSQELFDRVQAILAGKGAGGTNRVNDSPEFPLRVFVRCGVCCTPLTGSFGTGKLGRKYPYYYCREKACRGVSVPRDALHAEFAVLLDRCRPNTALWPVLRTALMSVWRDRRKQEAEAAVLVHKRIEQLEERKQKILDAMLDVKITQRVYEEQTDKIEADLVDLRMLQSNSVPAETELQRLIEFSEWFLNNVAAVWMGAEPQQKRRIQQAVFPSGVAFTKEGFQTPQNSLFLNELHTAEPTELSLASPGGFEPPFSP